MGRKALHQKDIGGAASTDRDSGPWACGINGVGNADRSEFDQSRLHVLLRLVRDACPLQPAQVEVLGTGALGRRG